MGRLKKGILGPLTGKLANLVGYERLGKAVVRMQAKPSSKPRTAAQKAVNLRFGLIKSFISSMNDFTNVGFKFDVAGTTKIAQNGAVSYNLNHALIGDYPDFEMDYTKVMVTKGNLPVALNPVVEFQNNVLEFKWEVNPGASYLLNRDQVMMLAYFPANNTANFCLSGARRIRGQDTLPVNIVTQDNQNQKRDTSIETYIAFISDDRKSISNSIYVGRITL